jgi:hypothetical protein
MKKLCIYILIYSTIITSWAQNYFDRLYGEDGNLFPDLSEGRAYQLQDSTFLFSYYTSDVLLNEGRIHLNRLDSNGDLLFNSQIHEPGFYLGVLEFIPVDTDHFILLAAKLTNGSNQAGILLAKLDSSFETVWSKIFYDGDHNLLGSKIFPAPDGGFLIGGRIWFYSSETGIFIDEQVLVIRTDSMGEELWRKTYGSPVLRERVLGIAPTNDGGFLLAGYSRVPSSNNGQGLIIKIDHSGNQQWLKTYGLNAYWESFHRISLLQDGNFIIVGQLNNNTSNPQFGKQWHWIVKIAPNGHILWQRIYGESRVGTWLWDFVELPDGNVVAAGATKNIPTNSQAGFIMKITADGDSLWAHTYDRHPGYIDLFYSINTTLDGGFVLTGFARRPDGSSQDAWILKVDSLGCSEPGCIEITSTEEPEGPPEEESFRLWPNPASDFFWVEWPRPLPAGRHFIIVFDSAGRQILRRELPAGDSALELEVGGLAPGVYWCSLVVEGRPYRARPLLIVR